MLQNMLTTLPWESPNQLVSTFSHMSLHLASTPRVFLRGEDSGRARAHLRKPVSTTELVTRIAPPILYLLGTSWKNSTCHMNANTMSAERAIATGPACSSWRANVSRICPPKLKRASATTRIRSSPQRGMQSAPRTHVTNNVWTKANEPKLVIMTEKCKPFRARRRTYALAPNSVAENAATAPQTSLSCSSWSGEEASAGMLWPNRRGGRVMSTTPIRVRQTLTALNKPHGSFRKSRANIATNTGTLNTTTCNRMHSVNNQ